VRELAFETRIDVLQGIAQLLIRENARLRQLLAQRQGTDPGDLELELRLLREQLATRTGVLYGRSSEKTAPQDPSTQPDSPRREQSGHGPTPQPALEQVEQRHELDEPDRICPKCGDRLREWMGQYEESEEIDVVARRYRVVRHRRQKYRCGCGACVETALGPAKLIPGGRYSVGFAVEVAIAKYADHLPLTRQGKQMARAGLEVSSQTLWDQLHALAGHLEPCYRAIVEHVKQAPVIGADETTWPLMETGKTRPFWAWSLTREDAVCYRILRSRSADAAKEVLEGFQGTIVCDGYGAYSSLERSLRHARDGPPPIELAHCWAHVRRRFREALPHYPQAQEALDRIGELYAVEREIALADASERETVARALRRERSAPTAQALWNWMHTQPALPRSALGKAIAYTAGLWRGLTRFLDDPRLPLDNNATERGLRGLVVGRKNHYGSRSLRGTQVAALFYTLIETAKLAGVEPSRYLAEATRRALERPGTATLPHQLRAQA
jgi:transposase